MESRLSNLRPDEKFTILASYVVTALMLVCVTAALVQFVELVFTEIRVGYLIPLSFFIAFETLYSHRYLKNLYFTDPHWVGYRLAEWIVILFLVKVIGAVSVGLTTFPNDHFLSDVKVFSPAYWSDFWGPEFQIGLVISIIVWVLGYSFGIDLVLLEADERMLKQEIESGEYVSRSKLRGRLVNLIFITGACLIVLTTVMRLDWISSWMSNPTMRMSVWNTLIYFTLGLVLLSISQFSLLRARWYRNNLPVRQEIAGRWVLYSVLFILLLIFVAASLPTDYSMGFLATLNYLFFLLVAVINMVLALLLFPILLLISFIANLLPISNNAVPNNITPALPPIPPVVERDPLAWAVLLKSILYWMVFLGVITFGLVYYFREHRETFEWLLHLPFFAPLERLWNWLKSWLGFVNKRVASAIDTGLQRFRERSRKSPVLSPWRYVNLRNLTPRERVLFYFLAMVRRAGERGFPRKPASTPYEYARELGRAFSYKNVDTQRERIDENLPYGVTNRENLVGDIDLITDRFVEARYSTKEISEQDVSLVKHSWVHIRKALAHFSRKDKEEG